MRNPELTPEKVEELTKTLSETDFKIIHLDENTTEGVYFSKLGLTPVEFKKRHRIIKRHLMKVCDACDQLDMTVENITHNLLDAPVEILNVSRTTENILKRKKHGIQQVSDFYWKKITIRKLLRIPEIGLKRAKEVSDALNRIGLPELDESDATSLIYRFYDTEYVSKLSEQEVTLLKDKCWSMMTDKELSQKHHISFNEIQVIVSKAEKKLMEN